MAFEITIQVDPSDLNRSIVRASGEEFHVITDVERNTFGIGDAALKQAVANYFGKAPNDAFVKSPTPPCGDLYNTYNWEQVTVHLRPVSASITNVATRPLILKRQKFKNNSTLPGFFDVAISSDVNDTVEANWMTTAELSVSQSISYGTKFLGGDTSISFTLGFQQGGSKSRSVSVGQTSGVQVELQPGQAVQAVLSSNLGSLTARVIFEVYLTGVAAVNYNPTYKDHHFWALSIDGLRQALGLSSRLQVVEDITVGVYSDGEITLEDMAGNPSTRLIAPMYRRSVRDQLHSFAVSNVPTKNEIFEDEPLNKGTAGQDAQGRRNKLNEDDEPFKKGTAGQDAQDRRNKLNEDDEPFKKGTAGQDAQDRRNKLNEDDEPFKKGTAGQDAQDRRNKLNEDDEPFKKGTAGQDSQGRRNKLNEDDELQGKGTAGQDSQGRRN
jgi:hypothetical protein